MRMKKNRMKARKEEEICAKEYRAKTDEKQWLSVMTYGMIITFIYKIVSHYLNQQSTTRGVLNQ